jgi:hypothetical protein
MKDMQSNDSDTFILPCMLYFSIVYRIRSEKGIACTKKKTEYLQTFHGAIAVFVESYSLVVDGRLTVDHRH